MATKTRIFFKRGVKYIEEVALKDKEIAAQKFGGFKDVSAFIKRPHYTPRVRPWQMKWMPSNNIIMVNNPLGKFDDTQREYQFRVPPKMTKHDLLEYFQKVYNVNNIKTIQTVNYDGKRKRRGQRTVREKAYKKVNVTVFLPGDPAPKKGDINHRFLGNGGNSPSGHPKGDNKWGEDSRIYNRWIRWKIATEGEQGTESSESEDKNEVKPEGGFLSNVLGR